jgi:hypothetical protein
MQKSVLCSAAATLAITLGLSAAHADGLPGMRGHDHTGITVPDMNEALTFFVDVLGCKKAMSFGPIADPEPNGTFIATPAAGRSVRVIPAAETGAIDPAIDA